MMDRTLTEQKVLKQLDIPDFRHLSKDKVIAFASLLPKMNPEVAKKALEQFPDFASTTLDVMKNYKDVLEKSLDYNSESSRTSFEIYGQVMSTLQKMIDADDLSFDEKTYILNQMKEIALLVDKKDSENKNTLIKIASIAGTVALGAVAALSATLGANIATQKSYNDNDNEF